MPYKTEVIPPEIALEHKGVIVYHTYRNEEYGNGRLRYWFTTNPDDFKTSDHFDVRILRVWTDAPDNTDDSILGALRRAIDSGELKPFLPQD